MKPIEFFHELLIRERRAIVLSNYIAELLPPHASVLDVGCGDGQIAFLVKQKRQDISMKGVDVLIRADTGIPVEQFDGTHLPYKNRSFNAVLFIDVLHHTDDPHILLSEASRVSQGVVIIKDHLRDGAWANITLKFMDKIGNRRHGVRLPYNYWSENEWKQEYLKLGLKVNKWQSKLHLYPFPLSLLFDRSLHFIASLSLK